MTNRHKALNLAIVIPAKNESNFIERTLAFVIRNLEELHTLKNVESKIVVVDDGSTDDTPYIVKNFQHKYGFIELLRLKNSRTYDSSLGVVRTVHIAVRYLEAKHFRWNYLMQVDADTILLPGYVRRIIAVMQEHNDIGIAGGIIVNERRSPYNIPNTGMTVRREVWEQCGGYMPTYSPDTILQLCAIANNWKIAIVRTARMYLMRPTRLDFYRSGFVDAITGTPLYYVLLRAIEILRRSASLRETVRYLAGNISGLLNLDKYNKIKYLTRKSKNNLVKIKIIQMINTKIHIHNAMSGTHVNITHKTLTIRRGLSNHV